MATPRHLLVDPENECDYHLVSRCVRRAFLCGVDEFTKRDCSHRRQWLVDRLKQLAPCFAVDVYAYSVLSNHFHVVLRHDPLAGRGWSDEDAVRVADTRAAIPRVAGCGHAHCDPHGRRTNSHGRLRDFLQ